MENLKDIIAMGHNTTAKQLKKGHILQRQGQITNKAYFIKKGLLISYTIDTKGKQHIFMFAPEGWIIADNEAQAFGQPAELFIEAIEEAEVVVFNRDLLTEPDLTPIQLRKNVTLLARRVAVLQKRVILLMSATAKERYEYFLETYPELPNRVPQRMIATYLGITPQALSKIRGEITRSK